MSIICSDGALITPLSSSLKNSLGSTFIDLGCRHKIRVTGKAMGITISLMACQSRLLQKTNLLWQAIACKETARPVIKGAAKGQLRKTSWELFTNRTFS